MKNLKDFLLKHIEPGLPEPCIAFGMMGDGCRLGAAHPAYAETYWRLINEEHNGLGRRGPVGYLSELTWLQKASASGGKMKLQNDYYFCIFTPTHKVPIGMLGLHGKEKEDKLIWETGTFIGHDWQRQGIGTQAKMFLLNWVSLNFGHDEIPEIFSRVYSFNTGSLKTQQKCGYVVVEQDEHPKTHYRNGQPYQEVLLRVTPGASWLENCWNPYAQIHNLKMWSPKELDS